MRSAKPQVRNPLTALPASLKVAGLPPEAREAFRQLMREIALDARERAEKSWRTHKAPMAAYWKAVSVYAGHAARIAR